MTLQIKPGDLSQEDELSSLNSTIRSRAFEMQSLAIDLSETREINLAQFNALVMLYVKLKRSGKELTYFNMENTIQQFVNKTNFHHVFQA